MINTLKWVLATLTFFCEVALWAGVGRIVWRQTQHINSKFAIVIGVLASLVVIVLWGLFLSPKASYRISLYSRIVVISILTLVTGYLLYRSGDKTFGLILMIPMTIIQAWGQYVMDGM